MIPGQALRYRAWNDEYVLYNNLSGDTHLIEASAMQVLLALQCAASDEATLTNTLHDSLQLDADEVLEIPGLLADLHALNLIEHVAC